MGSMLELIGLTDDDKPDDSNEPTGLTKIKAVLVVVCILSAFGILCWWILKYPPDSNSIMYLY